ncbi:MAG TPA: PadR family transcriptional regulator [Acidimicrobiales bacterium]|jgi:DNA-binding PadR family transcriptional regulator|nr:PadR family transcriptional regulator [Acidimicrobiales bacterium]
MVGPRLSTPSYVVMGLLSIAPMSGYDVFQAVERSVGLFWPISKSQVYAEMSRLEPLGLIDGQTVSQERLPDKRVFRLTNEGEQALDAWLERAPADEVQLKIPFLLKTFLGHRRAPAATAGLLDEVAEQAAEDADRYRAFYELLASIPDASYARMAALFGLRLAEAIAGWATEARALVPEQQFRIDPRREHPRNADAMFKAAPRLGRER